MRVHTKWTNKTNKQIRTRIDTDKSVVVTRGKAGPTLCLWAASEERDLLGVVQAPPPQRVQGIVDLQMGSGNRRIN